MVKQALPQANEAEATLKSVKLHNQCTPRHRKPCNHYLSMFSCIEADRNILHVLNVAVASCVDDRPSYDSDGCHVERGGVKMPGTVGVTVLAARNLPVMDRASELTDAFVEVRQHTLMRNLVKSGEIE